MCKVETLSVIDRSCVIRFSVYFLLKSLDRVVEYEVVLSLLLAMERVDSALWIERVLLLFPLNCQKDSGGI